MSASDNKPPSIRTIGAGRRQAGAVTAGQLVRSGFLAPEQKLPFVIQPAVEGVDLIAWAAANQQQVRGQLAEYGAILFRGFPIGSPEQFEQVVSTVLGGALPYRERSSPRSQVQNNIYTSTEHPADQAIFLHNEQSYNQTFPQNIAFCSLAVAQRGGETPLADCRRVFARLDPAIRRRLLERGYMYVRNFGAGMGLAWQEAFQTEDPAEVERYCQEHAILAEWLPGRRLRTRQIRRVAAAHPETGAASWFNHLTFFHLSTLDQAVQAAVRAEFADDDLPNNTYYGDGAPIEPEVLEQLRAAYHAEMVAFPWQVGDILLLDNLLVAHARAPFVGPRKVVVAMARPLNWNDLDQPEAM